MMAVTKTMDASMQLKEAWHVYYSVQRGVSWITAETKILTQGAALPPLYPL